ncbi:MAG: hypothetical protein EU539_05540 [Promethearchaeota archaeon]|nr:MAG: hypothetical protein EU539_05540 [Candidatus Lokiarchaeota archaeon]
MSKEEMIQEIRTIYLHLTDQEPTPDEEIEAREKLLEIFTEFKDLSLLPRQNDLIENIINELNEWDTLELWFKETENLPKVIEKFLKISEKDKITPKVETKTIKEESLKEEITSRAEIPQVDISKIVSQVTEQFKGEIDNLKGTIAELKAELDKKEGKIKDLSEKRVVKKITPKKEVKLAPPEIKIPSMVKPKKPLHVTTPAKHEVETPRLKISASKLIKSIEEEIKEETENEPPEQAEPEIYPEKETQELIKPEISTEKLEEIERPVEETDKPKLSPLVEEMPSSAPEPEIPFKSPEIPFEEKEPEKEEEIKLSPLPVKKPKELEPKKEAEELTPLPSEKPQELKKEIEEAKEPVKTPKKTEKIPEEPMLTPIPKEKPKNSETPILQPTINEKIKISPIHIEEIDTDEIKSSGTDLFNVFSSVGSKSDSGSPFSKKEPAVEVSKKKEDMKEQKIPSELQVFSPPISKETPMATSEKELPSDKDSLYQELIALEGRRYSLEKSYKDISNVYAGGQIDEYEFTTKSEELKNRLDEISSRITTIRKIISNL